MAFQGRRSCWADLESNESPDDCSSTLGNDSKPESFGAVGIVERKVVALQSVALQSVGRRLAGCGASGYWREDNLVARYCFVGRWDARLVDWALLVKPLGLRGRCLLGKRL